MAVQYHEIQELLRSRADLHARLNLMPYDGTPEIKERGDGKYLYVRKRIAGKQSSTYVGRYTEELYNLLLRNAREAREIRKSLRSIEKQLAAVGYSEDELSVDVVNNIAFARANMKMNIYDQAVLEGVATSFPQTEEIIENGKVSKIRSVSNLLAVLRRLGMELEPVSCGGVADEWNQEREQWHSGANFFAIAPGKVLSYARNIHTLDELSKHGFEVVTAWDVAEGKKDISSYRRCVVTIDGSELPRGGGGARCMTMPVSRKSL